MSFSRLSGPGGEHGDSSPGRHISGAMIGIVTDNVNPEGDYRVRVRFPTLPGTDTSWWCRIATFGAHQNGTGSFFLPEIDSEVVVIFNNGDFNQGIDFRAAYLIVVSQAAMGCAHQFPECTNVFLL